MSVNLSFTGKKNQLRYLASSCRAVNRFIFKCSLYHIYIDSPSTVIDVLKKFLIVIFLVHNFLHLVLYFFSVFGVVNAYFKYMLQIFSVHFTTFFT